MPQVEAALYSRLTTYAGLTALVSTRTYDASSVPQKPTTPFVAYRRVSTRRHPAMGADTDLIAARFQVDALGTDYSATKAVGEQIRAALQRWSGSVASVTILDTFIVDERDLPFEPDTEARGVSIDAIVWARE